MKKTIYQMRSAYSAPKSDVMTLDVEGILCASGEHDGFDFNGDWEDLLEGE